MNKESTLILIETNPETDIFFNDWIDRGYKAEVLFRKINKPLRVIRRVWLKNNLPFSCIWLGKWFKDIKQYDALIIHSSYLTRYLPFVLSKVKPDLRIINWYWNTVDKDTLPIKTNNKNIEYWSFDKNDCAKYKMNYNIQYYIKPNIIGDNIGSDIYFIGRDKGRIDQINRIELIAKENGLLCDFIVLKDNDDAIIPYREVKSKIKNTKCILEINKDSQIGLTLRALESLFFEKKLITNNKSIKEIDFYNKNNIFVVDEDNWEELSNFVNSPYDNLVNKYKNKYELDTWFSNFFHSII